MKAYKDINEWLDEMENYSTRRERMLLDESDYAIEKWVIEAWRQATRTSRVQEVILQGEIKMLKENIHYLEEVLREEMK